MRIVSLSSYARVSSRCRDRDIWACLSRKSDSLFVLPLNLPQKDWEGRLPFVDLTGIREMGIARRECGERERNEAYAGERSMAY